MHALIRFMLAISICGACVVRADFNEDLAKAKAALPDKAAAHPQKPRKLLIVTATRGYRHSSIPLGAATLQAMGEKTGAFQATISDDIAAFEPAQLAQYDGVLMLSTTGELFRPAEFDKLPSAAQTAAEEREMRLKKSLLDFVRSGKGLIGIHAATDCFYQWADYGDMIGGYFDGHPWHELVGVRVDDATSPINAPFEGKPFTIADEIYQIKGPYSRTTHHVLLSLDTSQTDMTKQGINRKDGDFPIAWIKPAGAGRVFYCSLGHREEIFWNPAVLKHYLAGIQYALGDLTADATPGPKAAAAAPSDGWTRLFNGVDLKGWSCKEGSWGVEEGAIARLKGGSDIWTEQQFGDFELELDFKLTPKANSGVFFRTSNLSDPVQTGIEFQVIDSFGKPQADAHDCGAIYDCMPPKQNAVKAPGEWNHMRLVCAGPKITAQLNGVDIIDMDLDRWTDAGKNPDGSPNKFNTAYKDMPRVGHIGFQDHGNTVWYRNVRIKAAKKG